ncbi:hypothetical protein BDY19DRAFT_658665 [Irpex rosettiformis]|uniref:Uncharacterized protein n=1 Tax=Irpex rosettiformis TaxID=378272 RepID=A0ACB8TND8_9APHY|nr:hypothetical protein BDY19DRAFT_658665 [Irpex rosettiformis]
MVRSTYSCTAKGQHTNGRRPYRCKHLSLSRARSKHPTLRPASIVPNHSDSCQTEDHALAVKWIHMMRSTEACVRSHCKIGSPPLSGTNRDKYLPYSRSDHGQFPGGWFTSSGSQTVRCKRSSRICPGSTMCFSASISVARTVPTAISAIFVAFSVGSPRQTSLTPCLCNVNFEPEATRHNVIKLMSYYVLK